MQFHKPILQQKIVEKLALPIKKSCKMKGYANYQKKHQNIPSPKPNQVLRISWDRKVQKLDKSVIRRK